MSSDDRINDSNEATKVYRKRIFRFRWCDCVFEYKNRKLKILYRNWSCRQSRHTVPLSNIQEIRFGRKTDFLLDSQDGYKEDELYSLIQKPENEKLLGKSIDFWQKNLDKNIIQNIAKEIDDQVQDEEKRKNCHSLAEYFDKNNIRLNELSYFHIFNYFNSLKVKYSLSNFISHMYCPKEQYVDALDSNCLDYIFHAYSKDGQMTPEDLQIFFLKEQNEDRSLEFCERLIRDIKRSSDTRGLTVKQFRRLMCEDTELFSLLNPKCLRVWQSMDRPMSEYFIASSHNTYLTGNQITSNSSYEIYRHILRDNCRCVEIDVWNDGDKPVVCHGSPAITLTTKIDLEKVLEVINENAFVTTNYPLILSIENHLNHKNQAKMAEMMKRIFGSKLHTEEPRRLSSIHQKYPSPVSLKGKIFVKGSKIKLSEDYPEQAANSQLANVTSYIGSSSFASNYLQKFFDRNKEFGYFEKGYLENEALEEENDNSDKGDENSPENTPKMAAAIPQSPVISQIDPSFSALITLFQTTKVKGVNDMKNRYFFEMCSFTDSKSSAELRKDIAQYRIVTSTNMIRIYPTPSHIQNQLFSANYYPLKHWDAGAQMVALNYQTRHDMLLNAAMFQLNGCCGYVLKPAYLRFPNSIAPPTTKRVQTLSIRIIGGIFVDVFSKSSKINLKVLPRVYFPSRSNLDLLDLTKIEPTRIVKNNGYTPIWNETFEFELNNPELSIVQFVLINNDKFVGEYTIAYEAMRSGTRCFKFRNRSKQIMHGAMLFVNIQSSVPKPIKPLK